MKRFIKKVKWLNVLEALLFLGSLAVIIHDLFMVTVYSWFTSQLVGWTWFGLATFMLAIAIASLTYEDLEIMVEGRADGILIEDEKTIIDEIKTTKDDEIVIYVDYNLSNKSIKFKKLITQINFSCYNSQFMK